MRLKDVGSKMTIQSSKESYIVKTQSATLCSLC